MKKKLNTRAFLGFVLPDKLGEGHQINLTIIGSRTLGTSHPSVNSLLAHASKRLDKNLYYTPFTFNGKRLQRNAVECRAFFVDLDVGPSKPFASKTKALEAVAAFCKLTKSPQPNLIVDSGGGVHAYWVLEDCVPAQQWVPMAEAFKRLCLSSGFQIDPGITADSARVLRLPGTFNWKSGKNLPTKAIQAGARIPNSRFQAFLNTPPPVPQTTNVATSSTSLGSQLGQLTNYAPVMAQDVFAECELLRDVRASGGEHCQEPLWRGVLFLLAFCQDGDKYIHEVSEKHPGYVPANTVAKFAQAKAAQAKAQGPTLCKTLEQNYPGQAPCSRCSQKVSTPLHVAPPTPVGIPGPPSWRYSVKNGVIYDISDEGPKPVCREFSLSVESYRGGGKDPITAFLLVDDGKVQEMLEYSTITDVAAIRRATGSLIGLTKSKVGAFEMLIESWMAELKRNRAGYVDLPAQIGWADESKWDRFVFLEKMFEKDVGGVTETGLVGLKTLPSVNGMHALRSAGSLDVWKKHVQALLDTGVPEAQVVLAQAFAAPLVHLLSDATAVTVLVSKESGVGKTTLLRAADSVWYGPERSVSLTDTANSINATIMASRYTPIMWDEMQVTATDRRERSNQLTAISNVVFRTVQGHDKGRMNSAALIKGKRQNKPMLVISSNQPIADMLIQHHDAHAAMAARLLQLVITQEPKGAFSDSPLRDNYGLAGEEYVKFLIVQGRSKVAQAVEALNKKLGALSAFQAQGQTRMWQTSVCLTLVAARLAEGAGLLKFNHAALQKVLFDAVGVTQTTTKKAKNRRNPMMALHLIINDLFERGEYLESDVRPKRGPSGNMKLLSDITRPGRRRMWMAENYAWARLPVSTVKYAMESVHMMPYEQSLRELEQRGIVTIKKLVAPLPISSPRCACMDVDVSRLEQDVKRMS